MDRYSSLRRRHFSVSRHKDLSCGSFTFPLLLIPSGRILNGTALIWSLRKIR